MEVEGVGGRGEGAGEGDAGLDEAGMQVRVCGMNVWCIAYP